MTTLTPEARKASTYLVASEKVCERFGQSSAGAYKALPDSQELWPAGTFEIKRVDGQFGTEFAIIQQTGTKDSITTSTAH